MFGFFGIHPREAASADHFGRLKSRAAIVAHHLAKRIIGEPCHRRLQDGGIYDQIANPDCRRIGAGFVNNRHGCECGLVLLSS